MEFLGILIFVLMTGAVILGIIWLVSRSAVGPPPACVICHGQVSGRDNDGIEVDGLKVDHINVNGIKVDGVKFDDDGKIVGAKVAREDGYDWIHFRYCWQRYLDDQAMRTLDYLRTDT